MKVIKKESLNAEIFKKEIESGKKSINQIRKEVGLNPIVCPEADNLHVLSYKRQ